MVLDNAADYHGGSDGVNVDHENDYENDYVFDYENEKWFDDDDL